MEGKSLLQQVPVQTYGLERAWSAYKHGDWKLDTNYGTEDVSYAMHFGTPDEEDHTIDHDPVLPAETIWELDTLEDAITAYTEEGTDSVRNAFDAYAHLKDDWWVQIRQDGFEEPSELPGSETTLVAEDSDAVYEAVLNTHGLNHGQPNDLIDKPVRSFIQSYIEELHETVYAKTYVEQGLDKTVLETDDEDHDHLIEVKDQELLAKENGDKFGSLYTLKTFLGLAKASAKEYELSSVDERVREAKMKDIANATKHAGEEPAGIANLQNAIRAYQLPYHLEQDYVKHVIAEAQDEVDQYEEKLDETIGSFFGKLNPFNWKKAARLKKEQQKAAMERDVLDLGFSAEYRRSELIAETALGSLFDDPIDEIHAIVGAAHWPEIEEYAEQLENEELLELRE